MPRFSPELLLMGGVVLIVLTVGTALAWWLIHDQPVERQRFIWHQLIKDNFHLSLIDKVGNQWNVDIHYNDPTDFPISTITGERSLRIQLPIEFYRGDLIKFVNEGINLEGEFLFIIRGILDEKVLRELNFSRRDLVTFRDFKRHLLLKAMKRV